MVKGPLQPHPISTGSLDGVAIDHEKVKRAVSCVQDFCRHLLFTQRNFFSETGISMLNTADAAEKAFQHSSKFDPWRAIELETGAVFSDLQSCQKKVFLWRKTLKDVRERWFGADSAAASTIVETGPRTTVRFSHVVELGGVQFFDGHHKLGHRCCRRSVSSPREAGTRRVPVSCHVPRK